MFWISICLVNNYAQKNLAEITNRILTRLPTQASSDGRVTRVGGVWCLGARQNLPSA